MHLRRHLSRVSSFALTSLVSLTAHSEPTAITLDFSGTVSALGAFNGAPNVFGLSHGSAITGSLSFSVNTSPPNPGSPNAPSYANTIDAFTFLAEAGHAPPLNYSSVNIHPDYGIVQFYVNTLHGGFSDVFTSNFYAAPGSSSLTSLDFTELGRRIPAYGEWLFQRHEFASGQTVQYRGPITAFAFATSSGSAPVPPVQVAIPATWILFVLGGTALLASRRRVRG